MQGQLSAVAMGSYFRKNSLGCSSDSGCLNCRKDHSCCSHQTVTTNFRNCLRKSHLACRKGKRIPSQGENSIRGCRSREWGLTRCSRLGRCKSPSCFRKHSRIHKDQGFQLNYEYPCKNRNRNPKCCFRKYHGGLSISRMIHNRMGLYHSRICSCRCSCCHSILLQPQPRLEAQILPQSEQIH